MIKALWDKYKADKVVYTKMYDYYKGKTDVFKDYLQTDRSNLVVTTNYLKKFVKEETSYSVGNQITYDSKSKNKKATEYINEVYENFNDNHDINAFLKMVLFGLVYEVAYLDKDGDFQVKIIDPTQATHIENDDGSINTFVHFYNKLELVNGKIEEVEYAQMYKDNVIITYKRDNESFLQLEEKEHYWGEVPVSLGKLSDLVHEDTIYSDIKRLQDALETNFSDIVNEISDFRNSYLVLTGLTLDDEKSVKEMKKLGVIENPNPDGKVEWLIKNVNDSFIQNTLKAIQEKLYEITSHINSNDTDSMSNASGVALKSRLINLIQRCKFNENSYTELLKTRIRLIFKYAEIKHGVHYDWKDIKAIYTPLIPNDDNQVADMVQKLDGFVSKATLISQLSFVENANEEIKKVQEELNDSFEGKEDYKPNLVEEEKDIEE